MQESRAIKFYLDESINKVKKDRIIRFLTECQTIENKLLKYYWNNFDLVLSTHTWIDFYSNRYMIREPRLKFHHYMQVLKQVYEQLESLQTKIINRIYFKFDDKEKQSIYNYCSGFCFNWSNLEKYIPKQLSKYKKKDMNYYNFLLEIQDIINNPEEYIQLKNDIENRFWENKAKYHCPVKKELQVRCNTSHTVDINKLNYYQWIFTIDNNDLIGGSEKRGVFDTIVIPVKFSDYHREILKDYELAKTFNLKLNKYGKVEIIGTYKIEANYPKSKVKSIIGIDIGLNKLITSSDGEIIEQNSKIVKITKRLRKKQINRDNLQGHLRKKYNDEEFILNDKCFNNLQNRLSTFVKCDNRFKIKQFLNGRENTQIIMEDLKLSSAATYNKEVNSLLKKMHIQQIKNDIIKYTRERGIKVSLVNPAYTSQQCPICGHISRENRKTQEKFCCVNCNHTDNADHNASINIMNRYGDKRITLDMPTWRVKEILKVS